MTTRARGALMATLLLLAARHAAAQPVRLRADALTAAETPVGLLNLSAEADVTPWLSAQAAVWLGASSAGSGLDPVDDGAGEALIINLEARAADGRAAAKLGRMVAMVGALRPLHLDGAWARASLPWRLQLEAFGGAPVAPGMRARSFDWLVGGRVGRRVGDFGSVGVAYLHQRDHGERATEELALDAGAALGEHGDAAARLTLDLIRVGLAEVQLTTARRWGRWRVEAFASERHASHLLPATSLFSVIGDLGAQRAGAVVAVRAAPRLDVTGALGGRRVDDDLSAEATLRARLYLGDRRAARSRDRRAAATPAIGVLGLELRRQGADLDGWTGARATGWLPVGGVAGGAVSAAAEVELVIPDHDERGAAWPWGLAALTWTRARWEAAVALEASATPQLSSRVDVLARLARRWEAP
ncbi:MAG: hypothetical protein R3B48_28645 [Kofleriaceae bacterium]